MACVVIGGQRVWSGGIDEEGYRSYKVSFIVQGIPGVDGPAQALQAVGLPLIGSTYFITANEIDLWAWRRPTTEVSPYSQEGGEKHAYQEVVCNFSNKRPEKGRETDPGVPPDDPLAQPPKISGKSVKYTTEATHDRYGRPINTSSHEQIRGAQNEWDDNRRSVTIQQNVAELGLADYFVNMLNSEVLWGNPPRTVKLSDFNWNKQWVGTVSYYYSRTLEFDIDPKGFDRSILDEGTKVLNGRWNTPSETDGWIVTNLPDGTVPNPDNPAHFIAATDRQGNPLKMILDGAGKPWDPDSVTIREFIDRGQNVPPALPGGLPTSSGGPVPTFVGTLLPGGAMIPARTYDYAITAVVAGVESNYVLVSGSPLPTLDKRSFSLSWGKVTSATSYKIYRKRVAGGGFGAQEWGLLTELKAGNPGYRWTEKYYDVDLALLDLPATL